MIHLPFSELDKARNLIRVSEGGHNVSPAEAESQIARMLKQVDEVLPLSGLVQLCANSSELHSLRPIATGEQGNWRQHVP